MNHVSFRVCTLWEQSMKASENCDVVGDEFFVWRFGVLHWYKILPPLLQQHSNGLALVSGTWRKSRVPRF